MRATPAVWLLHALAFGFTDIHVAAQEDVAPQPQAPFATPPSSQAGLQAGGPPVEWDAAHKRAVKLVSQMTLSEKINVTSGQLGPCQANSGSVPRLGIPSFCYNDGPAGIRHTDFVTQYPSQFTTVQSFDRGLIRELTERISGEHAAKGVNVELGPLTGGPLGRSPFTGRNWEAFTPDPYLSSQLSYIAIKATQSTGLIACAKHYFLYEQGPVCNGPPDGNGGRKDCQDAWSMVDDKTVKELYLPSFAEAVRAGAGAVMCSYNRINDTAACQSDDAMNRILKGELNFQGFVLSDFGATHSTVESANAGMDQELPRTYWYGDKLKEAVKKGDVKEKRLDEMVTRILTPWIALGQADGWKSPTYQWWNLDDNAVIDGMTFRNLHEDNRRADASDFVRRAAEQTHVLLKNEDDVLPVDTAKVRRIGVFGSDADYPTTIAGCGEDLFCPPEHGRRRWNGTVTVGGGSGAAFATYIVPPIEALSLRGRHHGLRIDQVLRDDPQQYPVIDKLAHSVQLCLVSVSVFLVEGWDRDHLQLDNNGEELIKRVADNCAGDVVVVIHAGGQVIMEDWIDHPKVKGVIFAGYPGQESGNALANILFGDVSPSGKLAFTIAKKEKDYLPNNIMRHTPKGKEPKVYFKEGVAIDYKWFDREGIKPRFEFGYGLSYSKFELSDLSVSKEHRPVSDTIRQTNEKSKGKHDLYDTLYIARLTVTNVGKSLAGEVPQLYMAFPESEKDQPPQHLRGFEKVFLHPGESRQVEFPLRKKDLSVWDVKAQHWHIPEGKFTFWGARSSRDRPLKQEVKIEL